MIRNPNINKDTKYEIERVLLYYNPTYFDNTGIDRGFIDLPDSILNYDEIMFLCGNVVGNNHYVDCYERYFDTRNIKFTNSDEIAAQNNKLPSGSDICVYTYGSHRTSYEGTTTIIPYWFQIDVRFVNDRRLFFIYFLDNFINHAPSYINSIYGYRLVEKKVKDLLQSIKSPTIINISNYINKRRKVIKYVA